MDKIRARLAALLCRLVPALPLPGSAPLVVDVVADARALHAHVGADLGVGSQPCHAIGMLESETLSTKILELF